MPGPGSSTSPRTTISEVARFAPSAKRWAAAAAAASFVAFASLLAFLLVVTHIVAGAFISRDDPAAANGAFVALAALAAVRAAATWGTRSAAQRSGARLRTTLRSAVLQRALGATSAPRRSSSLVATLGDDIDAMDTWASTFVPAAATAAMGPPVVMLAIAVLDPWSTLVLLFAGPMLVFLLAVIGGRTRALSAQRLAELGWLHAFYLDLLRGIGTLTAFNREADATERIHEVSERHGLSTMEVLRTAFQTSLVMEWAATAATALVAVQVSFRVVQGSLPYSTALAVLVLTPEFFMPLRRLALEYHAGHAGEAAWRELRPAVTNGGPAGGHGHRGEPATVHQWQRPTTAPAITLRGVAHTHPGADTPALRGVDLHLPPGGSLALLGPSGAGKTTLGDLLVGLGVAGSGTIEIDGHALGEADLQQWRHCVGWVPQHPVMLAGTVADNIRLGRPDASDEQLRTAVEIAGATRFLASLPEGLDTQVGEGALRLSGGERQRLAIARAALRDAPFVVLDEFTSHLDPRTEAEVIAAMRRLLVGRTAVVIAHRPATAALADRVAVMREGRIVAEGSPGDLLASGSLEAVAP